MAKARKARDVERRTLAIYHLRASVISRSQGRSATAAIAYRVAERITDRRTGLTFDYAAKAGVEHVEILTPDHASEWVRDRSELWNRVEEAETRKNSQVAREVRVALPAELTHAARVALVRGFAAEQFVARGMVADVALHAPGRAGDERNHHAHILLTTREVGEDGFTAKNRDWNKVELLEGWREAWARDVNAALERHGVEARVDHRTLAAQRDEALELASAARARGDEGEALAQTVRAVELDRPPLPQLSAGAWQMKERGIEVGRVAAWHEAKARAAEVRSIAAGLAREVGAWLAERAAHLAGRVREGPEAEGRHERPKPRELAARLREAWEARQARQEGEGLRQTEGPEREAPRDLAARLRAGAAGIDRESYGDRAAALRAEREAEGRRAALEAARAHELARHREIEREAEKDAERLSDRGLRH